MERAFHITKIMEIYIGESVLIKHAAAMLAEE